MPCDRADHVRPCGHLPDSEATSIETGLPETPIVSVIIAAATKDGNWGSSCYGLSAVRFVVSH